eukprot:CAMPEP_0202892912 /NCGR_PEP_ID=MMETSP1392-20130828/2584_1 /ASSEMBLY_ACC=CAM_ASM_000868 /TAXON_ID=225041 /ORGANISM="Chlamydomonas chlamydogama, Strain SAG 11-48b" /LENGTH=721 /DNA_ID=CAMNT_0049577045 /DNA_START=112 /DNA_END=2277 /DNA_ORIENTATION=-
MRNTQHPVYALAAVLLCLVIACDAQSSSTSKWYGVAGGSRGFDSVYGAANDGTRRVIVGMLGTQSKLDEYYNDVMFSNGLALQDIAEGSFFAAEVTSSSNLGWVREPRRCNAMSDKFTNYPNPTEVCQISDFDYRIQNISMVHQVGVAEGGAPVALFNVTATKFLFQQVTNNRDGWLFGVVANSARVRKTDGGWPVVNPPMRTAPSFGKYQTEEAKLELLGSATTNGRFYALFHYEGDVRLGKLKYGQMSSTYTVWADSTYIQPSTTDAYDVASNNVYVGVNNTIYPAWTKRYGMLLVSIDIGSGDLQWVVPIWGQRAVQDSTASKPQLNETAFAENMQMFASKASGAVYISSVFNSRLMFGAPQDFSVNGSIQDFPTGGTTQFVQPITLTTLPAGNNYIPTRFILRINNNGSVLRQPDGSQNIYRISDQTNNTRITRGVWGALAAADDDDSKVFLAGSWSSGLNSTTVTLLNLEGAVRDIAPALLSNNAGNALEYAGDQVFVAGFNGLELQQGPSGAAYVYGREATQTAEYLAASGGNVYVMGTFNDTIRVNKTVSYRNGSTIVSEKSLSVQRGKRDTYIISFSYDLNNRDAATITGEFEVTNLNADGYYAYVTGVFNGPMYFDSRDITYQGLTIEPRYYRTAATTEVGRNVFQVVWASTDADAPDSGSNMAPYDLRLGLGIGLGIGVPVLIAIALIIYANVYSSRFDAAKELGKPIPRI